MSAEDPEKREQPAPEGAGQAPRDGGAGAPKPSTWAGREWKQGDGPPAENAPAAEPGEEAGPPQEDGVEERAAPTDGAPDRESADGNPDDEVVTDEELEAELDADEVADEELAQELDGENGAGAPRDQDTVEADTPALADREAAREAALAGLRARAAEHAAKQGTGIAAVGERPPTVEAEAPAKPEQAPPAEVKAPPAPPGAGEPPRRGLWPRFVAGSFLIVIAMATATAISLLFFLTGIVHGLRGLPSVGNQLAQVDPGQPQTILILGSDKRPRGQEIGARSDTTMLLRVAPGQITVLSIPRDLEVNIPGHGINRFNAAYTFGGPKLTLKVVKQLTGLDNINHVVNVDFTGFADAVNSIDCVYVDVDHHYYHSNAGLPISEQYAEIDIPAGYQRMCGFNALQYVRYRHDDNDLVRAARQQEFLRDIRQQVPPSKILDNFSQLVDVLKKYVTSDIQRNTDLISLANLFFAARSAPVVQVHFPANLGAPGASYVTASESAIRQAVAKFEGEQPAATATPTQPPAKTKKTNGKAKRHAKSAPPLIDSSASGRQFAAKLASTKAKSGKRMLDLPVYYPTKLAPNSTITGDSRAFPIDGPGSEVYRGYKLVVSTPTFGYEAYYGVSGTDWKDPPILANPDETKTINGQDYLLSWDGPQLRLIGWKTDQGSYWIDNTLLNALTPGQMFAIAQSMQKYTG